MLDKNQFKKVKKKKENMLASKDYSDLFQVSCT